MVKGIAFPSLSIALWALFWVFIVTIWSFFIFYISLLQRKGKEPTDHHPEVILNNFTTRLGHSIGRLFAALFPQDPQFVGRQVATFHNQRDFIFFRFHRYECLLFTHICDLIFHASAQFMHCSLSLDLFNVHHIVHISTSTESLNFHGLTGCQFLCLHGSWDQIGNI